MTAANFPTPSTSADPAPKSLVAGAYKKLRADIIEGRLPPGSRLRVEHLKDDYKVGAGTLREALGLLIADALVTSHEQRGFRVAPIALEDYYDITKTRVMLECEALRQSIDNATVEWEGELSSAFHQLRRAEEKLAGQSPEASSQWELCNQRFHQTLLANCPSRWMLHFLTILYRQSERYRRISLAHRPPKRRVHDEHTAIFDAAMAHDADKATSVLADHFWATYHAVRDLAEKGEALVAVEKAS
jgi:GntR family carbon starvation induced transcriptional regulator